MLHDKWTLERLIGEGGMGAVYAARHRNGARAAVKVLSAIGARVPHVRKRFLHEGYAANRVDHPGAVKVLDDDVIQDAGPDEGTAYLVMELLEGESLQERATRESASPLGERDLLEIAAEVLAVLDAAHSNGVVHRDLKPDNLFLAKDPDREDRTNIKVLDFGLARLLDSREVTVAGMALGTPTYMSPEQAAGHVSEIDGRTDLYALGSILFQLVSNRRIHDAGHTLGLVVRMATTPAPKLRTVAPDVSEPFALIVDRALEFRRDDRYLTAAFMRADVMAALEIMRATEPTSLNVVTSATPAIAKADTVAAALRPTKIERATAAATAAAASPRTTREVENPANQNEAISASDADSAKNKDDAGDKNENEESTSRDAHTAPRRRGSRGLPMRAFAVFAILTIGALVVWRNDAFFRRMFGDDDNATSSGGTAPTATPSSSATPTSADPATIANNADASVVVVEDASTSTVEMDTLNDGGDAGDEDDDDDDDDPDASVAGDASPSSNVAPRARTNHGSNGRPGAHGGRKTPKRPGTTKRRKRWHW